MDNMQKVRKQQTYNNVRSRIDAHILISSIFLPFPFFLVIFPLSELGTLLSVYFDWHVDVLCRSHGV